MQPGATKERIRESRGVEDACPYLPGLRATIRYRFIESCSLETYQAMLERGWRRFGPVFFRPACAACGECRSLRLPVDEFRPDRSQRRTLARNADLETVVQEPSLDPRHLDLYTRYHADMALRRGWGEKSDSPLDYAMTFVEGHRDFGKEMLFLAGDRLLAVALFDVLPRAISAVYCYYEPAERARGLGVNAVLHLLRHARELGLPHLYLGYWVAGNASMRYKAGYRPHELLSGRPELTEGAAWSAAMLPAPAVPAPPWPSPPRRTPRPPTLPRHRPPRSPPRSSPSRPRRP